MLENIIKTSKIMLVAGTMTYLLSGCGSREENLPSNISFYDPVIVPMASNAAGSEKRKFADFNGDGIEDMGEVNDEAIFGQDYRIKVFPGYLNNDGLLTFSPNTFELKLPLKKKFLSSATKIDSGDINGDGYSDIVFTRYVENIFNDDEYHVDIALSDKDGSFNYVSSKVKDIPDVNGDYKIAEIADLAVAIIYSLQKNNNTYSVYNSENISDYLALDWADSNKDGKDDLYVFWKTSNYDLIVTVFPVEDIDKGTIYFKKPSSKKITNFMYERRMQDLDTEDYNGDGIADLCIYHPNGQNLTLSVALGSNNDGDIDFQPQKDVTVKDTDMKFFTTLEKYDSFDGDNDGRADVVHIGILNGEKVLSYNFSKE